MKRSKLLISLFSLLIIVSLFITACSSDTSDTTEDIAPSESAQDRDSPASGGEAFDSIKNESSLEPEKVITNIDMHFETTDFSAAQKSLNQIISKHDSYVENSNIRYNNYYNSKNFRHASYTIRVPKDKISSFKEDLNGVGNILSENTNKADVTKEYNDTQSRLNILETKEERLLNLLEKAEKIEDIIALENQLNEVVYEKERLKSRLLDIDDKVDFSTVNLEIEEVERLSNVETTGTSFGKEVRNALSDSLYSFKIVSQNLLIGLIYFLPFGVILAILGFISFKIYKRIKK